MQRLSEFRFAAGQPAEFTFKRSVRKAQLSSLSVFSAANRIAGIEYFVIIEKVCLFYAGNS